MVKIIELELTARKASLETVRAEADKFQSEAKKITEDEKAGADKVLIALRKELCLLALHTISEIADRLKIEIALLEHLLEQAGK